MNKILISFFATKNDVGNDNVSKDSPNYNIHKHFYNHNKHYIIYTNESFRKNLEILLEKIKKDFPSHEIEDVFLPIIDPINISEIKDKLFLLLKNLGDYEIDIFISPGTPSMQIAWFILHISNVANTKLVQGRKASDSPKGIPEFFVIDIEKSEIPYSAIIKQTLQTDYETLYPIGDSIKSIFDKALKVAYTDNVTVLIRGESGTGKEYLARFIHEKSERRNKKFIAVNCSSLNDELLESRLFGHKKGSFTGAINDQIGFFEAANGGTIFLDEIGDISARLQQSLLRVLQNSEIIRVGESEPREINVRVIAATNKNLEKLCENNLFRWDLYYRLNVVELELPPLRLRTKKELEEIFDFIVKEKAIKFSRQLKKERKPLNFPKDVKDIILRYSFPGNIRELENLIESFYVFCEENVSFSDLPKRFFQEDKNQPLKLDDVIKNHTKYVLNLCNGNKSKAAKLLGCSLNTLKKYLS